LNGITTTINANTSLELVFQEVVNPKISGSVGSFVIEILEPDVNNLLGVVTGLTGPTLTAGEIFLISLCPNGGSTCLNNQYVPAGNVQYLTISATT
jgi:hypothetical protein